MGSAYIYDFRCAGCVHQQWEACEFLSAHGGISSSSISTDTRRNLKQEICIY